MGFVCSVVTLTAYMYGKGISDSSAQGDSRIGSREPHRVLMSVVLREPAFLIWTVVCCADVVQCTANPSDGRHPLGAPQSSSLQNSPARFLSAKRILYDPPMGTTSRHIVTATARSDTKRSQHKLGLTRNGHNTKLQSVMQAWPKLMSHMTVVIC